MAVAAMDGQTDRFAGHALGLFQPSLPGQYRARGETPHGLDGPVIGGAGLPAQAGEVFVPTGQDRGGDERDERPLRSRSAAVEGRYKGLPSLGGRGPATC